MIATLDSRPRGRRPRTAEKQETQDTLAKAVKKRAKRQLSGIGGFAAPWAGGGRLEAREMMEEELEEEEDEPLIKRMTEEDIEETDSRMSEESTKGASGQSSAVVGQKTIRYLGVQPGAGRGALAQPAEEHTRRPLRAQPPLDGFSISDLWLPPINLRWTGETPNPGRFHFPKLETMILGIQKNFLGKIELNLATLSPKVFRNV